VKVNLLANPINFNLCDTKPNTVHLFFFVKWENQALHSLHTSHSCI